jgi:hypothetical protein
VRALLRARSDEGCRRYWREAPLLVLTGDSRSAPTTFGIVEQLVASDADLLYETPHASTSTDAMEPPDRAAIPHD